VRNLLLAGFLIAVLTPATAAAACLDCNLTDKSCVATAEQRNVVCQRRCRITNRQCIISCESTVRNENGVCQAELRRCESTCPR
jgi:hypothetical protein